MTGTASRPERPATGAYRPRPTPRPASRPAPPTRTAAAAAVGTYTSSGWGKAPLVDGVVIGLVPQSSGWVPGPLLSVEITAYRVAVEACCLELAHEHADVLWLRVCFP